MGKEYRPEIDGLRALAVLPVVLFHSGLGIAPGGYVGVDVFFVISGFLITRLIYADVQRGQFSITSFYERRCRRILPALFVVLMVSSAASWIIMSPESFKDFAKSLVYTIVFVSNFYFNNEVDYFSTASDFRVLLHTWSLAIEEQYYIIWPVLIIAASRFGRNSLQKAAIAILIISFFLSVLLTANFPESSFYLLHTRAWQLLIGAVLALGIVPSLPSGTIKETVAALGVLMIGYSILVFDATTVFPGYAALVPCLGACLVIYSGGNTFVGQALSWRPIVFVGLISYSLYLWHWPAFALNRIVHGSPDLPVNLSVTIIVVSIFASILSWRFVEQPFRNRRNLARRSIFNLAAAGAIVGIAAGLVIIATSGFPSRFSGSPIVVSAKDRDDARRFCKRRLPKDGLCQIGRRDTVPTVLLWGDSHAGAIMPAIDRALRSANLSGVVAFTPACAPILGIRWTSGGKWKRCADFRAAVLEMLEAEESNIDTVVFVARWPLYVTGATAPNEGGDQFILEDWHSDRPSSNHDLVARGLDILVTRLSELEIRSVFLGGVPEIGWDVPSLIVSRMRLGLPIPEGPSLNDTKKRNDGADLILTNLAVDPGVDFIPIAPLLCRPRCLVVADARLLYEDDDHLTIYGARNILGTHLVGRIWPLSSKNEALDTNEFVAPSIYKPQTDKAQQNESRDR